MMDNWSNQRSVYLNLKRVRLLQDEEKVNEIKSLMKWPRGVNIDCIQI